jgi:exodeoxyribonuclease VIII
MTDQSNECNHLDTILAGLWEVTPAEYHAAEDWFGSSMLNDFRQSIPLFHGRYIAKTMARREPTAAMKLGSALDVFLLLPDQFKSLMSVAPDDIDRRTKAGKEEWAAFERAAVDKLVITADQFAAVQRMAAGLIANPMARDLLRSRGASQQAVRWEDDETGLPLKCLFDRVLECGIFFDLKTSNDPHPDAFARSVVNFGYHRQAAHYRDGHRAAIGECQALHIVCGSEPPHDVHVFELDMDALELGRKQNRETLRQLEKCRALGNWSSRWAGDFVNPLSLPKYAFYQE